MASQTPVTGTATVTVACKLPHGLICRVHAKQKVTETTMGGTREVVQWFPTGEEFVLKGNSFPQNVGPRVPMAEGFALTRGISKDLWELWLEQNKMLPAVRDGMIFAHESSAKTEDEAKEKAKVRTGFERIDPLNLPAEFSNRVKVADEFNKDQIAAAA